MSGTPSASVPEPPTPPGAGTPRPRGPLPLLQRSIRYHRPRAPFCGVGYCTNCLVRVNGRTNVRACREGFDRPGTTPTANAWPSPSFDLLGILDLVFPRGIDTLRGFRRPAAFTPIYQRVVRRLSGYDDPPTGPALPASAPPIRREVDVAVVGAGVSGTVAAEALRQGGTETVLILDRDARRSPAPGVELLPRTTAIFLPPPEGSSTHPFAIVATTDSDEGVEVRARAVIVATGGYDASLLFSGNDRPGVLTAEGAFALSAVGDPPFDHAVVFGGGARARETLAGFPGRIAAVVAPGDIDPDLVRLASERGVPLYPRSLLLSVAGRRRVRAVALRTRSNGQSFRLAVDAVILAHRRVPHPQLFFQAGAQMQWRSRPAAYFPIVSESGQTTVAGLYAVGEAAGVFDPLAAVASARRAASSIARPGPPAVAASPPVADRPGELEGYYRELLHQPRGAGKWIACPCEDVLLHEVEEAEKQGYRGIEVIKRYTGLGTGLCQGRYCLPDALLLLSILEERRPSEVGYITQRPPVLPTTLGALASFAPPTEEAP